MTRLIQTATLLALAVTICACDLNASSKSASTSEKSVSASEKKKSESRPEQFSMVTVANELAAKARLMSIATAEAAYQAENGSFATLDELVSSGLVGDPTVGKVANYRFEVRVKSDGFEVTAVPASYGITGKQSFYLDETRTLRGADKEGEKATASDPVI